MTDVTGYALVGRLAQVVTRSSRRGAGAAFTMSRVVARSMAHGAEHYLETPVTPVVLRPRQDDVTEWLLNEERRRTSRRSWPRPA